MTIELDKQIVETVYGLYELMHLHNQNLQELNSVEIEYAHDADGESEQAAEGKDKDKDGEKDKVPEILELEDSSSLIHDHDTWVAHRKLLSSDSQSMMLKLEGLVKLLTQSHTNADALKQEFENIRTFKYLSGETFLLGAVLPLKAKRKR